MTGDEFGVSILGTGDCGVFGVFPKATVAAAAPRMKVRSLVDMTALQRNV
jgi:hypothetical protein